LEGNYQLAAINSDNKIYTIKQNNGSSILKELTLDLETVKEYYLTNDEITLFEINNDDILFLLSEKNQILLFDSKEKKFLKEIKTNIKNRIITVLFSDQIIIPCELNKVSIYNIEGELIKNIETPYCFKYSMLWEEENKSLIFLDVGTLFVYDFEKNKEISKISFHNLTCCGVDISPDFNYTVSGDFSGNCIVWSNETGMTYKEICVGLSIRSICWRLSDIILIGCLGGNLYEWNIKDEKLSLVLEAVGSITCIKYEQSKNPKLYAVGTTRGNIYFLNTKNKTINSFKAHEVKYKIKVRV
jgi:hypothetical protein